MVPHLEKLHLKHNQDTLFSGGNLTFHSVYYFTIYSVLSEIIIWYWFNAQRQCCVWYYYSSEHVAGQLWLQNFSPRTFPWKLGLPSVCWPYFGPPKSLSEHLQNFLYMFTGLPFDLQVVQFMFRKINTDFGDRLTSKLSFTKLCDP